MTQMLMLLNRELKEHKLYEDWMRFEDQQADGSGGSSVQYKQPISGQTELSAKQVRAVYMEVQEKVFPGTRAKQYSEFADGLERLLTKL
ncbi:hypothetical protein D3C76_1483150 [compost metagenome]